MKAQFTCKQSGRRVPEGDGKERNTIRFWPDWRRNNPYQQLFYQSLETYGFIAAPGLDVNRTWLQQNGKGLDFIHIHWPEKLWRRTGQARWKEPLLLIRLTRFLIHARSLGIKVVWTIHNLAHHEGASAIDRVGYAILKRHSDLMIVHSEAAATEVRRKLSGPERVVVMEHGNYVGCYPPPRDREDVISALGLDSKIPIVSCLGIIRSYKGIDLAIEAVKSLNGRVQLIIGGHPRDPLDAERLSTVTENLPYVKLIPRKLSPQEFSDFHGASDFIVLPYRNITGSGALLAAWSLGRCVVASNLPFFREARARHPGAIDLFERGNAASLSAALLAAVSRPARQRLEAAILARSRTDWPVVIESVAQALNRMREDSSESAGDRTP